MSAASRAAIVSIVGMLLLPAAALAQQASGGKLSAAELAQRIDGHILASLKNAKIAAGERCSDVSFLRRVSLDVLGVIPTSAKVTAFLESNQPDKRARLIDELLADPRYGRRQADLWQARLVQEDGANTRTVSLPLLHDWLAERFNRNQPWDALVRDVLTASGTQKDSPAAIFYLAGPAPDRITDKVAQLFMGVRLDCAQCHDHPFTKWKQTDYWGMAAFFGGLRYEGPRITNPMGVNEFGAGKSYPQAEAFKKVPARYLRGDEAKFKPGEPLRPILARWLTAADNPFFARAAVNRVWHQFLGRGLVQPVDDMIAENEPSHPALLKLLAEQFVASGFDVKHLTRAICLSETYQRTAAGGGDDDGLVLFARMPVRVLAPEQLYDSLAAVVGVGGRVGKKAPGKGPQSARDNFIDFFKSDADDPTEYRAGIPQALRLMNAETITARSPLVKEAAGLSAEQGVERLFMAALSRPPTPAERERYAALVRRSKNTEQAYSALLWALVNCSEFVLNH